MLVTLILQERRSRWAGRLRPMARAWGTRVVETRSVGELASAASPCVCPVVMVDGSNRSRAALAEVEAARRSAPSALILAILEGDRPEYALALREAGATWTLPATVPPPRVIELLRRWVALARERSEGSGWAADRKPEPEPWEALLSDMAALPS